MHEYQTYIAFKKIKKRRKLRDEVKITQERLHHELVKNGLKVTECLHINQFYYTQNKGTDDEWSYISSYVKENGTNYVICLVSSPCSEDAIDIVIPTQKIIKEEN